MSVFLIEGGRALKGDIRVHGAKNSVLPILAAALLNKGINVIHNCPGLRDVEFTINILKHLGCKVTRDGDTVTVDSSKMDRYDIPDNLMREMRSSVIFLGAILARAGKAKISYPGGCELGPRPIDLHLSALRNLGAEVLSEAGNIVCDAKNLVGKDITLSIPSVGATENIMLVACACKGTTRILNAAREPEIEDLQNFLCSIGVKVTGAGTSVISIEHCDNFKNSEYTVISDRIVASTYLIGAAITGGHIRVTDVNPSHMATTTEVLRQAGCSVETGSDYIEISRSGPLYSVDPVRTTYYPGFPTDLQAPMMALATKCMGTTVFVENIFENRYRHVPELIRMGADINVVGRVAVVSGVPTLYGVQMEATDLRGGAAMIIAALVAEGKSEVSGIYHIDRGYYHIENALSSLGADIIRS